MYGALFRVVRLAVLAWACEAVALRLFGRVISAPDLLASLLSFAGLSLGLGALAWQFRGILREALLGLASGTPCAIVVGGMLAESGIGLGAGMAVGLSVIAGGACWAGIRGRRDFVGPWTTPLWIGGALITSNVVLLSAIPEGAYVAQLVGALVIAAILGGGALFPGAGPRLDLPLLRILALLLSTAFMATRYGDSEVFLESQSATAQADAPDLYFWTVWGESRTEELRMQARLASDGTEFRALPDYSLAGHHWMSLALDQGRDGLFLSLVPTRFGRGALPARLTAPRLLAQAGILPSDVAVATQGLVPRAAKALAQRREDRALLLFIAFDISYGHESLRATDETMQSLLVRGSDGPSRKRLVVLYQEPQGQGARAVVTGLPGRMAGEIEEEPMSEEQFQALLFPPPVSE